jgi:predicted RNA binding protein YcfA (HicA-like mRNA interferase family)
VRQIKAELMRAGFSQDTKQGKGSHSKWTHPLVHGSVILSGHDGDDAQPYQEKYAREALRRLRTAEENQGQ